jgi:hypothetical protein
MDSVAGLLCWSGRRRARLRGLDPPRSLFSGLWFAGPKASDPIVKRHDNFRFCSRIFNDSFDSECKRNFIA